MEEQGRATGDDGDRTSNEEAARKGTPNRRSSLLEHTVHVLRFSLRFLWHVFLLELIFLAILWYVFFVLGDLLGTLVRWVVVALALAGRACEQ